MPRRYDKVKMEFIPKVPGTGVGTPIKFPAYIQSLDDSYSPQWDGMKDIGRADVKYMYSQFNRTISLTFSVVILKPDEKDLWLDALNSLLACTYPIYKNERGYNGVFVGFKIGELLNSTGIIEAISYNVNNDSPWISNVPVIYTVNMTINVIENKKPKYKRQSHRPIMGGKQYGQGGD